MSVKGVHPDRNGIMQMPSLRSTNSEPAECHNSLTTVKPASMTGLAIIDTGASRSVIGNDLVPAVLEKLPSNIRGMVREQPSKVGFRFGNNQVSYSFKQLQIPLIHGKHRIWLLIEVVPKATPFLLSIKAMKSLGANIDLSQNTCFLKNLQRSLPLRENSNGLFMIDISDLCQEQPMTTAAAFVTSSDPIAVPPGLPQTSQVEHAESPGSSRSSSLLVRRSDGESQDFVLHALHDDQSSGARDSDAGVRAGTHQSVGERSSQSESKDSGTGENHHQPIQPGQVNDQRTESHEPESFDDDGFRVVGGRRNGVPRNRPHARWSLPWKWSGPQYFTASFATEDDERGSHASSSCQVSSQDRWNSSNWSPVQQWQKRSRTSKLPRSEQLPRAVGADSGRSGSLGKQSDRLGQETSRKDVCSGVRHRSGLHQVGSFPHVQPERRHGGLCQLCPDASAPGRSSPEACSPVNHWETLPSSHAYHAKDEINNGPMMTPEEARWLMDVQKLIRKGNNNCQQLDLLEVYAYPNSQLTEVAQACGLKAKRFTLEDGDLQTSEGRTNLLLTVLLHQPKHVWLSPECRPWSPWNRFNASRSMQGFHKVKQEQNDAKVHIKLCNLISKIQVSTGRHVHMENPWSAGIWKHPLLCDMLRWTIAARLDQCMFGLQHPNTEDPMQKRTRVQTTSREMFALLDDRLCNKQHSHHQIAGSCQWKGHHFPVSKFAGFYPRTFAKAIVKGIISTKGGPIEVPVMHADDFEPPAKRQKTEHGNDPQDSKMQDPNSWKEILETVRQALPKSGAITWTNPMHPVVQGIQKMLPELRVGAVRAGKGLERYIAGDTGWVDELPIRYSVALKRFTREVEVLGQEEWPMLSKIQQHRKACPSHVLICVFAQKAGSDHDQQMPQTETPAEVPDPQTEQIRSDAVTTPSVAVPTWTPLAAAVSGPKFQSLSDHDKGIIKKLHNNLGHPTAEKLSRHLAESNAQRALIEGASDYLCASCAERRPPSLTTPGNLKDATEFNEKVYLDGFDWEGKNGVKAYVLHFFDEATRFHLGVRTTRDTERAIKVLKQTWFQWAGPPQNLAHDQGGEFMTEEWKMMLQENNIRPVLSVAPWQRGRIERHGGIVQEMLNRIDNESNIKDLARFDEALQQCFHAKNTMSIVNGYSPEQAVLGRATKLPASIVDDENMSAHLSCHGTDLASDRFRQRLELRSAARAAFSRADNSDALRRALARQSRGVSQSWACGQLCMYWDKRKSPNMIEKGRWNGPAQIVCQESRTIIWITHMNRLLRCAQENLRPVSLREFQQHSVMNQTTNQEQLQQMAQRLQLQLKERSGLFQYADLSTLEPENPPENNPIETQPDSPANNSQSSENTLQPEEEPNRQASHAMPDNVSRMSAANQLARAQAVPVPNSPISSTSEDADAERSSDQESHAPSTASLETDNADGDQDNTMEPVYNVTLVENMNNSEVIIEDDGVTWGNPEREELACASFAFDVPKQQLQKFLKQPTEYLPCLTVAAKKSRSEVLYSELSAQEKELFRQAKQKELKCWLDTNTVKAIVRDRIHPSRILASRWILTWKEDQTQPSGKKPKARLVVKGFQDPDLDGLCTDSPTLTRDSRMLLLQTISSMQWIVQSFDITTAFLRGKSDNRELAMEAPSELKTLLGMDQNQVCLLQGNAYGRVDAPLLFYREFRKRLEAVGFTPHPLDNCLFLLRNPIDPLKLDGILGTHVDDGIGGGNHNFEKALEKLQKELPFGSREYNKFKFTGLDIEQLPDFSIKVNQGRYIQKISPIDIPKSRRAEVNSPVTSQELNMLRGLCGSLQYAAVHSRPDLSTKVACLQKGITSATVETLLEGNRVLREAQNFAETAVIVRPLKIHDVCFASFGDASFASAKQLTAQQGLFIMACTSALVRNETTEFSPIVWHSKQIGRVVRSTLSAEAYAMSSSLDKLTWIRTMWGFIKNPKFAWSKPETALKLEPKGVMITDCKSLYDLITKNAVPNCQEWRTTIEVMLLKEQSKDHTVCRWISTAIMIADCLTKPMDTTFMRTILQLGKFRIYDEDLTLKQNANRKYGVTWVNNRIFKRDQCEITG